MKDIFLKRRSQFQTQILKYSRYVLNDHFVLVLLFLLGFLLVQYSQLLKHFPRNHFPMIMVLVIVIVFLLFNGKIATYIENPDKLFLLTKERDILREINSATRRAFIWQLISQSLLMLLFLPIFLKLGFSLTIFFILLCLMAAFKSWIITKKKAVFIKHNRLNWNRAILLETKRQQTILKFFSLFTTVKGVTTSVRRRQYCDWLLKFLKKSQKTVWQNLYFRAFLRSGDYLGLTFRLLLLSLLSIILIDNQIIVGVLVLVFNYLLLFQLLPLINHFDYSLMNKLMPVSKQLKLNNLKSFISSLLAIIVFLECLFSLKFVTILIVVFGFVFNILIYLPFKLKKMID